MIGYTTLGTNDLPRAAAFYDQLLGSIGAKRWMEGDRFIAWACTPDKPALGVITPYDGKAATVGNGTMVAFSARSWKEVEQFHAQALAHGGTSEGAPGLRPQYTPDFYAAYVRDPDGNKLAAVCRGFTEPQER